MDTHHPQSQGRESGDVCVCGEWTESGWYDNYVSLSYSRLCNNELNLATRVLRVGFHHIISPQVACEAQERSILEGKSKKRAAGN